jgi:general stress protein YciG
MPRERKMSREQAGRMGGEASAGKERHFTSESKERLIAGARKGGENSAGTSKHFTPQSKERQIEGARRGGQHSHRND